MTKTALIRCENRDRRTLPGCFTAMTDGKEAFAAMHGPARPAGSFTCHCPGDNVVDSGKILKSRGAEIIHFCACAFAKKTETGWETARKFHELIWPQMRGAGHEAVVNLLRMSRNTADAVKATRPKGEFFRHKKMPQFVHDSLCFFKMPKIYYNRLYLI